MHRLTKKKRGGEEEKDLGTQIIIKSKNNLRIEQKKGVMLEKI